MDLKEFAVEIGLIHERGGRTSIFDRATRKLELLPATKKAENGLSSKTTTASSIWQVELEMCASCLHQKINYYG